MSDTKYSYYSTAAGYKIVGKSDSYVLTAGGGTIPVSNFMSTSHVANGITSTHINNWDTAFGFGNHAGLYKPIGYVPSWSEITGKPTIPTNADYVDRTTAQTIAGTKTFSSSPVVPTPTLSTHVVNKSYVDGNFASKTDLPEAYLTWGGKNHKGTYGPIDAAMVGELGANRLAYMNPVYTQVDYSQDGGSTWIDYGATDEQKVNLFNGNGTELRIGKNSTPRSRLY